MKVFWSRLPFSYKLFIGVLGAIVSTLIFLLFYIQKYETSILIDKFKNNLQKEAKFKNKEIKEYFQSLFYEISFLSKLEVMDDLIVKDTDRRITKILELKAKDLKNSITISALAPNGIIYASSDKNLNSKISPVFVKLINTFKKGKNYFFDKGKLYFFTPIYASFDKKLFIGHLLLAYPLSNLSKFAEKSSVIVRMIPPKDLKTYLNKPFFKEIPKAQKERYVILQKELSGVLQGWKILYVALKKELFSILYHLQNALILAFLAAISLITLLIWLATSKITKPLKSFVETIDKIIKTGNYSERIEIKGEDEIAKLVAAFNHLMQETKKAFDKLQKERKEHLETLIMLINFLSQITSAKTFKETIEISIKEIKRFSFSKDVYFGKTKCPLSIKIERMDIENSSIYEDGYICIKNPKREWFKNETFINALSKMISLQIQSIDLLEHTKEVLKAKNSFFSAMSHELKTPLGSILSLTQTMMRDERDIEKIENLAKMEQAAYNLLRTINDILDIAKAESGKINLHIEKFPLCEALQEVLDMLLPLADEKDLNVEFNCQENLSISSDKKLLKHLVSNLISNAIKFTDKGDIKIEASKKGDFFEIVVEDSGEGIDKESLNKIFEEFYRTKNKKEGNGLGLALSKKLSTLLNGDLSLYSEGKNKGTKAIFRFKSF